MTSPLLVLAAASLVAAAPAAAAPADAVREAAAIAPADLAADATGETPAEPATGSSPAESPAAPAGQAGAAEAAAQPKGGRSWFAFPVVFWLPETKLGIAAAGGIHYHVAEGAGDSSTFLVAGYTLLGQSTVDLSSNVFLKNGTLLVEQLRFAYYPDVYYGIGPTTTLAQREDLTREFAEALLAASFPVVSGLRLGPRLHARTEKILRATPGGEIATGQVPGATGFTALGLGVQLTWDTRDNVLWTTRGSYVEAWYLKYPGSIGRNAGFYRGAAEARLFEPLGRGVVLGFAAQLEHADATTPFSILPKIGSTRYLRGIRDGRFRDAIAWAGQSELRVPLAGKFSATAFAAFGDVTPTLSAQRWDTLKVAGGAGLRYRLTNQGANIRADLAISPQGDGLEFYVLLLEAF